MKAGEKAIYVYDRAEIDSGKIAESSIAFDAGDDLTTEKKTASISIAEPCHPNDYYLLAIEKPVEATAETLTVTVYNEIKINGTDSRDTELSSFDIGDSTGAVVYECKLIQGLFVGEGSVKIGAKFAVDSGAVTVYFKLFRL